MLLLTLSVLLSIRVCGAESGRGSTNRSNAIKALCARLEIGPGAVVADVGCGDGPDTMVFAAIVGERGTVLAQEIDTAKLKKVVETADTRGFRQVVPVLGQSEDPHLPDGYANLIYMNRVFHHFARPQAMLQHLRADLKPGGWLVIVDQRFSVAAGKAKFYLLGSWGRPGGFYQPASMDVPAYPYPPYPKAGKPPVDNPDHKYPFAHETLTTGIRDATLTGKPYPIKGWLVYATNLFHALPNEAETIRAILQLDLLVVVDVIPSEIAGWADVVLPESTYQERHEAPFKC